MSTAVMTERIADASPRTLARIAGSLYLIIIVAGAFAIGYVPAALVVAGDAAATVHNIQTHELLYRLGLVAHVVILPANVLLAVILYDLFKVVNRRLALLVLVFTVVGTAVEAANVLTQFTPLVLLEGGRSVSTLTADQLQAQVSTPLALQAIGYNVSQVFYDGYLLCAAYLIFRSTFLPRALGVVLAIGGLSYLTYNFADFLSPRVAAQLVPLLAPGGIAEIALMLWLLLVGVNVLKWQERANAAGASLRA
jgi:Domain of unknown function (DUF4386)